MFLEAKFNSDLKKIITLFITYPKDINKSNFILISWKQKVRGIHIFIHYTPKQDGLIN